VAGLQRRDPRRIVAAVFQPPQSIHHARRDRLAAENSYDSAHAATPRARSPLAQHNNSSARRTASKSCHQSWLQHPMREANKFSVFGRWEPIALFYQFQQMKFWRFPCNFLANNRIGYASVARAIQLAKLV
jgi:hypothetical protein